MVKIEQWIRLPGKSKRFRNLATGEEISYREARKRGIAKFYSETTGSNIPVRFPTISPNRPYSKRKEWLRGKWQLIGIYSFSRIDEDGEEEVVDSIGYSRSYEQRDLPLQRKQAINWAITRLSGSGWRFLTIRWERWLRR